MPEEKSLKHIAVMRLSALGDVCHAILVVQAIMKRYPEAEITWITAPLEANLVRLLPNVKVVVYDKKTGLKGMLAIRKKLSNYRFDALLHLQWSIRASVLTRMLKADRRIGFSPSQSREKQHWFVNEQAEAPRGPHVLDSFLSVARVIGVEKIEIPCHLAVGENEFALKSPYVVVNPCGSKVEKNWTVAGYLAVIRLIEQKGYTVVLTGGPSTVELDVAKEINLKATNVVNLVGKSSIPQLCSVIKNACLVVSPDTGPAHIATLFGVPILGLYALSNPHRTGPYNDLDKVVSVYDELVEIEYGKKPQDLPWATTVHDPKAMQYIEVDAVVKQLEAML